MVQHCDQSCSLIAVVKCMVLSEAKHQGRCVKLWRCIDELTVSSGDLPTDSGLQESVVLQPGADTTPDHRGDRIGGLPCVFNNLPVDQKDIVDREDFHRLLRRTIRLLVAYYDTYPGHGPPARHFPCRVVPN